MWQGFAGLCLEAPPLTWAGFEKSILLPSQISHVSFDVLHRASIALRQTHQSFSLALRPGVRCDDIKLYELLKHAAQETTLFREAVLARDSHWALSLWKPRLPLI